MSTVGAQKFTCESCNKTYTWKPELAGKKAKCKCGFVMTVPKQIAPPEPVEEDTYDIVDVPEEKPAKRKLALAPAAPASDESAAPRPAARSGVPLSYQGMPGQRKADKFDPAGSTMMDPMRDIYAPVGLLIAGFLIQIIFYAVNSRGGNLVAVSLGVSLLTAFKAVLLIAFAFVMAGPLGVSFGGLWTMILKLAAIACFCDGVTTWVDAGVDKITGVGGMFGMMISFPVSLGVYWALLIYLFSMDAGDSWLVVVVLSVFDYIIRTVIFMLLMSAVLSWGGAAISGGGAGRSSAASSSAASETDEFTRHVDEMKDTVRFQEARQYIEGGRQGALKDRVDGWYAAGAKNVWFEVDVDINQRMSPNYLVVELPDDPAQRAAIFQRVNTDYKLTEEGEEPLKDQGQVYLQLGLY